MKPFMAQKQKGRSQASDVSAVGVRLPWKYKAHAPDSWNTRELLVIMGFMISLLYIWMYSQSFGYPGAQHIVGQGYLKGAGVMKDEDMARYWFRRASQQDHPVGKLKNTTGSMEAE